uniref:Rho-GAP domain-containing protein n=1 Tax=Soboliphyme baturini TaxID=241478 RepID=A0A183J179_9BILA
LISRLEARYSAIKNSLGVKKHGRSLSQYEVEDSSSKADAITINNSIIAHVPRKPRRKRIGLAVNAEQTPKLFGGSLEEYVEITGQEIPLIIRSCVRMLSLFGLHHQGVFRVSGSQLEINAFKEAFEKGEDPLANVTDSSDVNSVAGVLKLYFRELREPLFPLFMFDQFVECACLETKEEFIEKVRDLVQSLPRPVFVVMRYMFYVCFSFDENMMDPYNLAICFGPTLLPIPESKDQVFYHNHVNELMRNLILYHDEIFVKDGGIVYEKYLLADKEDTADDDDDAVLIDEDDMMGSFMDTSFPARPATVTSVRPQNRVRGRRGYYRSPPSNRGPCSLPCRCFCRHRH